MARFTDRRFTKRGWTLADQPVKLFDDIKKLLRHIELTAEVENSCDDVYQLIDQFSEMIARSEYVSKFIPLVQRHLEMCSDCCEEFKALCRILETAAA
ncbi:MAG TPA: hypothetical protein ENI27_09315 [bacterium]|nr:hypothetical protein [bacterium]